jgi:peptidoglycan/xylan/chitin deacetylase (PgdA/CDA1 family)
VNKTENIFHGCFDIISSAIHPLSRLLSKNKVRILTYHRVCDLPETNDIMSSLNVLPEMFERQMEFLAQNGFNVITLEEFIEHKDKNFKPPPKTVLITFDDGYRDNYLNAFPVLQRYKFNATFFVVTDYIDNEIIFQWLKLGEASILHQQEHNAYWLPFSRQNIIDMNARGAGFGSHTSTHRQLGEIEGAEAEKELRYSKEQLEKILSKPVRCLSYPHGSMSKSVKDMVKAAGYRAAVTTMSGSNTLKSDFLQLRRITINGQDSLARFRRVMEGAYDWWFEYLMPVYFYLTGNILRRRAR